MLHFFYFQAAWKTPKLQEKPPAIQRKHPTLQNMKYLDFFLLFFSLCCLKGSGFNPDQDPDPILIQIQIQNTDYDLDKFLQAATRYACN